MNNDTLFHLGFNQNKYRALYAILPGDPGRVPKIAEFLDNPQKICQNREYNSYIGTISGENVIVCSTGIGGPSAAIAVEELYMAGVRNFVRVGTCGAIREDILGGDIIIAESAVRQEGTSLHYAPPEYPATADFSITQALFNSANQLNKSIHVGVVQSKDSFYGQHSPERMPVSDDLLSKWNAYKKLGVLASEMECAAIFTVSASLGCKAGCVLNVIWNQERAKVGLSNPECHDTTDVIKCTISAINLLISKQQLKIR